VRKHITRTFGYVVYYTSDDNSGDVVVLTIQHPAQRAPF
jgi:hypothetical protein